MVFLHHCPSQTFELFKSPFLQTPCQKKPKLALRVLLVMQRSIQVNASVSLGNGSTLFSSSFKKAPIVFPHPHSPETPEQFCLGNPFKQIPLFLKGIQFHNIVLNFSSKSVVEPRPWAPHLTKDTKGWAGALMLVSWVGDQFGDCPFGHHKEREENSDAPE